MPKIYTVYHQEDSAYKVLKEALSVHMLKPLPIDLDINRNDIRAIKPSASIFKKLKDFLAENDRDGNIVLFNEKYLYIVTEKKVTTIAIDNDLVTAISKYIIKFHWYTPADLSCRSDASKILPEYTKNGSPNFRKTPEKWIRGNAFFNILRPRPFYNRLLAFNLDKRGAYLKVWNLRTQHNYFHPSVNSGLPATKKKDQIHEGTFLMHDMFHFIFFDPIVTGFETDEEKAVYIACRMMSEACTLVLADMVAVAHSGIENLGYDIRKRQIYPLFKSLNLDPFDIETVRKVLYANCVYVLFGDTSVYEKMGANRDELAFYTSKYYKFFSGDFAWNEKNINRMVNKFKKTKGLQKYFDLVDKDFKAFNTHALTDKIRKKNGMLSFNSLFDTFWDQLEQLIRYNDKPNTLIYSKTCLTKFLSGQIYLACEHDSRKDAKKLIKEYKEVVKKIRASKDVNAVNKLGENFLEEFNVFIDNLGKDGILLPHEVLLNKLHVPHFPSEYVNYDINDSHFESLKAIAKRILGRYFEREKFDYRPIDKSLKEYYLSIVNI